MGKPAPLVLKIVRLLKDRFIFDDNETGLYFDISPIKRNVPGENEAGLNNRIDSKNRVLQGIRTLNPHPTYLCSLFLLEKQVDALSEKWQQSFAAKTILMMFRPGVSIEEVPAMRVSPWMAYANDGFLWSSPNKVYTWMNGDNLGHRFSVVSKNVVDAYDPGTSPAPQTPPSDPGYPPDPTYPPPAPVARRYTITGKFGRNIVDLTVEIE